MTIFTTVVGAYRQLHKWIARREEPTRYRLFRIRPDTQMDQIEERLHRNGYYYNDLSTSFLGQRGTWRKLVGSDHQIHIRVYKSGIVTGHFEVATHHGTDHLNGVGYRLLTPGEIDDLVCVFSGFVDGDDR